MPSPEAFVGAIQQLGQSEAALQSSLLRIDSELQALHSKHQVAAQNQTAKHRQQDRLRQQMAADINKQVLAGTSQDAGGARFGRRKGKAAGQ